MFTFINAILKERAVFLSLDLWVTLYREMYMKPEGSPGEICSQHRFYSNQTHCVEACIDNKINQKAVTLFLKDLKRVYEICLKVVLKGLNVKQRINLY